MASDFEQAQVLHRFLVRQGAVSTCMNCCHYQPNGNCEVAQAVPPAEVLVFGCPSWDNILPF